MDGTKQVTAEPRGLFERPDTPAQSFSAFAGMFLVALGVLSLIFASVDFGTVGPVAAQPEFLIWSVTGWTAVFWIAIGVLGILSAVRLDSARSYATLAGVVFAIAAIWGFIDGNDVLGLLTADTTNNITHAALAALGLIVASLPRETQRPHEQETMDSRAARMRRTDSALPTVAGHR